METSRYTTTISIQQAGKPPRRTTGNAGEEAAALQQAKSWKIPHPTFQPNPPPTRRRHEKLAGKAADMAPPPPSYKRRWRHGASRQHDNSLETLAATLEALKASKASPESEVRAAAAVEVTRGALAVLKLLHSAGGTHRRVSPDAILWDGRNGASVQLIFSDAYALQGTDWDEGEYSSPHVCHGSVVQPRERGCARDDLYSLLYITVQVLEGKLPWTGRAVTSQPALKQHCQNVPSMLWMGQVGDMPPSLNSFALVVRALDVGEKANYDYLDECIAKLAPGGAASAGPPPAIVAPSVLPPPVPQEENRADKAASATPNAASQPRSRSASASAADGRFVIPRRGGSGSITPRGADATSPAALSAPTPVSSSMPSTLPPSNKLTPEDLEPICVDMLNKGECERGSACRYKHPADGRVPNGQPTGLCFHFLLGKCKRVGCTLHHFTLAERRRYLATGALPDAYRKGGRAYVPRGQAGDVPREEVRDVASAPPSRRGMNDTIKDIPATVLLPWNNPKKCATHGDERQIAGYSRPVRTFENAGVSKLAFQLAVPNGCLPKGLFNAKVWVRLHWAADIASENAMRRLFDEVNTQLSRAADPSAGVTTWSVPNLRKRLLELVDEEQVVLPEPSGRRKRVRGDNRTV
ncbi:hypothetical protein NFJ02_31g78640 [Pycnococcus provasolii]